MQWRRKETGTGEAEPFVKEDKESIRMHVSVCKGTALHVRVQVELMGWREQCSEKPLHIDPTAMTWQKEFMWPLNI